MFCSQKVIILSRFRAPCLVVDVISFIWNNLSIEILFKRKLPRKHDFKCISGFHPTFAVVLILKLFPFLRLKLLFLFSSPSHSFSLSHTHKHTLSLTLSLSYTNTHTHTRMQINAHTKHTHMTD